MSIATSLTVQGQEAGGGASSGVVQSGTNLNTPSVQVGGSSHAGTFEASGTVEGSITNNGYLTPFGSLTVTGNYTQAADAALTEMFGSYSTLNVKQNATISGALNIEVNPKHPRHPARSTPL